jgi:hypothetical protein
MDNKNNVKQQVVKTRLSNSFDYEDDWEDDEQEYTGKKQKVRKFKESRAR